MYFKSLTLAALLVFQCTTTSALALGSRSMIEIVHGGGSDAASAPQYSANYHSVFARDSDPEPAFELVPISVKDKIISLRRRGAAECEQEYTVEAGETCHDVANKFGIHLEDFYYWNPQIDTRCKNMKAGRRYCVKNRSIGAEPEACAVRHKGKNTNLTDLSRHPIS
ncbi:hypothetical protein BX666DRAFT_2127726 [Dichotomocladium elegans]|nr:hypothetical protein BX666DRAFT_2127726 [Dichotomocladium elegans]